MSSITRDYKNFSGDRYQIVHGDEAVRHIDGIIYSIQIPTSLQERTVTYGSYGGDDCCRSFDECCCTIITGFACITLVIGIFTGFMFLFKYTGAFNY